MTCIIAFMLLISAGLDGLSNGSTAGTTGWSYAVEAIQIVIVKKGMRRPAILLVPMSHMSLIALFLRLGRRLK